MDDVTQEVERTAEQRAERKRAQTRERVRRHRAKQAEEKRIAAEREARATPPARRALPGPIREQRTSGTADGRVLAVVTGAFQPGTQVHVFDGHGSDTPGYAEWLSIEREAPPGSTTATVVTTISRLSFDTLDVHDIARVASAIHGEPGLEGVSENDLREILSTVRAGSTFTLEAADPDAPVVFTDDMLAPIPAP